MINLAPSRKTLVLGTALWGWGIERKDAYELLELFFENGGTIVDTAINYPISSRKEDFGLAIKWLADWRALHPQFKFSLIVKVGAVDNIGSSDVDLSSRSITNTTSRLRDEFGDSLACISIHWDNRGGDVSDYYLIEQTVDAMSKIEISNLSIGMSGIRFPELYYRANPSLSEKWIIQVKENFATSSAREAYHTFFPQAKYLAYGINLGGLKIEPSKNYSSIELRKICVPQALVNTLSEFISTNRSFQPSPTTLNELALAVSHANPWIAGVIIGPRNATQLISTLSYWDKLEQQVDRVKNFESLNILAKAIIENN